MNSSGSYNTPRHQPPYMVSARAPIHIPVEVYTLLGCAVASSTAGTFKPTSIHAKIVSLSAF